VKSGDGMSTKITNIKTPKHQKSFLFIFLPFGAWPESAADKEKENDKD
jgi:hypothetical protein